MQRSSARIRAQSFCQQFGLTNPVLEAPMAGLNSLERAVAIANAGSMGALGALFMTPDQIAEWVAQFRAQSKGALQINLWHPDPAPKRDAAHEAKVRVFLSKWGPEVDEDAGNARAPDFAAQCEAIVNARPVAASSIVGLYPDDVVGKFKANGVAWFATATTLAEARAAKEAGADAIIAQSFEAGGHRGAFDSANAELQAVGMMALLPFLSSHIDIPIIAAGGIADARGVAAALTLGASAVHIGTALLSTKESKTPQAWKDALPKTAPQDTMMTRAFSGRLGRAIASDYVRAANADDAPKPAPYPVQRGLTAKLRAEAVRAGDVGRMQAWTGQSAWMASHEPAGDFVSRVWAEAQELLP